MIYLLSFASEKKRRKHEDLIISHSHKYLYFTTMYKKRTHHKKSIAIYQTLNKRQRIPNNQSKMDNAEKLAHKTRKTTQTHNTICVGHHYSQTNTNNVNKTRTLLQTTGGNDEQNMILEQKYVQPGLKREFQGKIKW